MKIRWLGRAIVPLFILLLLSACSSGGGGSDGVVSGTSSVSGIASKGPIDGGVVTVYAINSSGTKGSALGSSTTASDGSYSLDIGDYSGSVIVEVVGGTYTDEATADIANNSILRVAVPDVSGNISASVTAYTEIAVQFAGATLSEANINVANSLVSTMLGGVDIVSTAPADVTDSSSQISTQAEKEYGLALATISQIVSDGVYSSVSIAINDIVADLSDSQLDVTGNDLSSALSSFMASEYNQTSITESGTSLDDSIITYTLSAINLAPTSNAGVGQNVSIDEVVSLDGSGSTDPEGATLTYLWEISSAPISSTAALSDATIVNPTFTADLEGIYVISLVVNDGSLDSQEDAVNVLVGLIAKAGVDQDVLADTIVTLDGSGSSAPLGAQLTYRWTITTMPAESNAILSDTGAEMPTFTADLEGIYVISLVVSNSGFDSIEDTVEVTVTLGGVFDASNWDDGSLWQ